MADQTKVLITPTGLNEDHGPVTRELRDLGGGVRIEEQGPAQLLLTMPAGMAFEAEDVQKILQRHGYMPVPKATEAPRA